MFHTIRTRFAQLATFLSMLTVTAIGVFGLMAMIVLFA